MQNGMEHGFKRFSRDRSTWGSATRRTLDSELEAIRPALRTQPHESVVSGRPSAAHGVEGDDAERLPGAVATVGSGSVPSPVGPANAPRPDIPGSPRAIGRGKELTLARVGQVAEASFIQTGDQGHAARGGGRLPKDRGRRRPCQFSRRPLRSFRRRLFRRRVRFFGGPWRRGQGDRIARRRRRDIEQGVDDTSAPPRYLS
jgi:hypothetical protein